ncbi:hypothetical protein JX265_000219 [Neoarthrinium moseri]|uniref:Transcription initiation factor IIF subunit alpha n=1 Tax=Neoarthrinium moseri TaxID=1658444 RepID=A0A9P9WY25_9PEZI|nr:hypothetical protein JX265_000219 [Neoarthrinium moseri]
MSASPSGGPNGHVPTPPPGKRPLPRRKPNPFRPVQKPHARPAAVHAPGTPLPAGANGSTSSKSATPKPPTKPTAQSQPNFEALRQQNGGWSFPLREGMAEFDLVLTSKDTNDALRSHIMRLVPPRKGHAGVNPADQSDFTRPVTLHRRDPRQPPPGRAVREPTPEETPEQTAEKDRLAQIKADRDAQRAIDDAQKAPGASANKKQPKQKDKPQGTKVNHGPRTEQQKKESEIRYEEALPWHLEDADGKNVWVGQYEAPLSDTKVAITFKDGKFTLVPLEKWYKFSSKRAALNPLTIEEAELVMKKKAPVARWAMRDALREQAEKAMAESRTIMNGGGMVKQESRTYKQSSRREKEDHDDIDMSGDEFQDDDENAGLEPEKDDDAKESKDKIRRDQLGANLFGDADEQTVEKEEAEKLREELERRLLGKRMKKSLKKRDKQHQYASDDDSERENNPFLSDSDDSDSDSESDPEKVKQEEDKDKNGVDSKGNNTPQGKKNLADAAKKGKSLKRPGSPMVSDSSGNESTRKTKKKKLGPSTASLAGSRSGTPVPGSQSRRAGAGSGSDAEATGGEMSDGALAKKKKKKLATHLATGTGSRGTPTGSRAGSPAPPSGARSPVTVQGPLTAQEVIAALPEDPNQAIPLGSITNLFRSRLGGGKPPSKDAMKQLSFLLKKHGVFNKENKSFYRKPNSS